MADGTPQSLKILCRIFKILYFFKVLVRKFCSMKLSIKVYREDILGDKKDVDGVAADLRHAEEYVEQPSDEQRLGK